MVVKEFFLFILKGQFLILDNFISMDSEFGNENIVCLLFAII